MRNMKQIILGLILFSLTFGYAYSQNNSSPSEDSVRIVLMDHTSLYGSILEQNGTVIEFKEFESGSTMLLRTWDIYEMSTWSLANYPDGADRSDFNNGIYNFDAYRNGNSSPDNPNNR